MNSHVVSPRLPERLWPAFDWLLAALMALTLLVERSYNPLSLLLLLLASLVLAWRCGEAPEWSLGMRCFAVLLLCGVALSVAHALAGRDTLSSVERPIKLLFALPVMLAVIRMGARAHFLYVGLALGMLATALMVSYQYYFEGLARPGTHYNPLPFSEVAMSAAGILLAACFAPHGKWRRLYAAGAAMALYSVLVSGSRGSLLAILPMVALLAVALWRRDKAAVLRLRAWGIAALLATIVMGVVAWKAGNVGQRIEDVSSELVDYLQTRTTGVSSAGIRLELWRGAWIAFQEQPLLGVGDVQREAFLKRLVENGQLRFDDPRYDVTFWPHAHNDYFDALFRHGLPGMLLVLALYASTAGMFWRGLRDADGERFALALGGLLVVAGYATYSLTEVPLRNGLTLVFFTLYLGASLGMLKRMQRAAP